MERTNHTRRDPDPPANPPMGARDSQRTMNVGKMLAVVVVTLLLAALFNADALVRDTETMPYGNSRDFWLGVWRPFQDVSDALFLDKPRAVVDQVTGRDAGRSDAIDFPPAAPPAEASDDQPSGAVVLAPTALPSPTPEPTVRPPTPSEPLRMWVGGDSLAGVFGQSLVRMSSDTGVISATLEYKISTGLARPDYYNWPEQLKSVANEENPEVMVLVFGSNDSQGLLNPQGEVYQPMSDGWRAEYARRAGGVMDLVSKPGRLIIWVGLPPMRDGDFSERLADINAIYKAEADKRQDVVYVNATTVLGDESGRYTAYLNDGHGHVELVREPDGVHLTRAGGDRLAAWVLFAIEERVRVKVSTISTGR